MLSVFGAALAVGLVAGLVWMCMCMCEHSAAWATNAAVAAAFVAAVVVAAQRKHRRPKRRIFDGGVPSDDDVTTGSDKSCKPIFDKFLKHEHAQRELLRNNMLTEATSPQPGQLHAEQTEADAEPEHVDDTIHTVVDPTKTHSNIGSFETNNKPHKYIIPPTDEYTRSAMFRTYMRDINTVISACDTTLDDILSLNPIIHMVDSLCYLVKHGKIIKPESTSTYEAKPSSRSSIKH